MKRYIDTETCGFYGLPIILQHAQDDGEIKVHGFWTRPIGESLQLLREVAEDTVVGFNLAFDWFQLCKMYTVLEIAEKELGEDEYPDEHIDKIWRMEERARDGKCYKPRQALDLMLHARKTEFQMTMERGDIRVRRVPTQLAWNLAKELEDRVKFSELLFARVKKNKLAPKWVVHDVKNKATGKPDRDFKDIVLKFKPSIGLKMLAIHALKVKPEEVISFADIEINNHWYPAELGYAPFAAALYRIPKSKWKKVVGPKQKDRRPWPEVIEHHINHWTYNEEARKYAIKDVDLTRRLDQYFGYPEPGDDDSELACSVAAVRWRGYSIDAPSVEAYQKEANDRLKGVPISSNKAKLWIGEALDPVSKAMFVSTNKVVLEKMATFINGEPCPGGACELCNHTGMLPAPEFAKRAHAVVEARKLGKENELYDKLLRAGRFHASFKITGALSNRMSGADGLNPQGINKTQRIRQCFPLTFGRLSKLAGGDFAGFEVVLADAVYHDDLLRKDLLTCEKCRDTQVIYTAGKKKCPKCGGNKTMKIHALFGMSVFPHMSYDDIKATDGTADDIYTKCKSALFALIYGGTAYTLMTRLGVPEEVAAEAIDRFCKRYIGVLRARERIEQAFGTLKQEGGIGTKIVHAEAEEYVESLLGFRRYFTLENQIVREIFALAEDPPEEWKSLKIKVRRRDRDQTASGACQSALFGAAFGIQSGVIRAAGNHEIQSSGAGITKRVQRRIWDLQPHGANEWLVQPMNIHDQVLSPTHPSMVDKVAEVVHETVESFRDRVPLIELEWKVVKSWGDK